MDEHIGVETERRIALRRRRW